MSIIIGVIALINFAIWFMISFSRGDDTSENRDCFKIAMIALLIAAICFK